MPYTEISIETTPGQEEILQGYLYTFPIGGLVVHDPKDRLMVKETAPEWVVVDDDVLGDAEDPVTVQMYVEADGSDVIVKQVRAYLERHPDQGSVVSVREVDEESWADSWKQFFKPLPLGKRLMIKPTWETVEAPDRIVLEIDPGMAFGSGTHETTQLCLEALEQVDLMGRTVADIGCGSGILSIAAALFGASHVQAVDIEPMSIRMTEENAAINHVSDRIHAREGSLLDGVEGPVDVLVSNILAEVLVQMIPSVHPILAEDGMLIFSGIIAEKKDLVVRSLTEHGFTVRDEKTDGGWIVLIAERAA